MTLTMKEPKKTPFEKILACCIHPVGILTAFLLIVISYLYLDRPIALYFQSNPIGSYGLIFNGLTLLGESKFYLIALFLLGLLCSFGIKKKALTSKVWFVWLCMAFSYTICLFLKIIFGRARPDLFLHEQIYGFHGLGLEHLYRSFPSGHTTTIMSIAFGLSVLYPKRMWIFLMVAILVAFSRIVLLQHFLSDILMATYLVILEVGLLKRVVYGKTE